MDRDPWDRQRRRHIDSGSPQDGHGRRRASWRRLWIWLAVIVGLLFILHMTFPAQSIDSPGEILTILILVTIGSSIVMSLRFRAGEFLRYAAIWLAVIGCLAVGYAFRHDLFAVFDRVAGSAVVERGYENDGAMVFERGPDGHFRVRAAINGEAVDFLVDTGASNVILARRDARRLGIDPPQDQYFERYYTANGIVMAAPVMIDRVTIGPITVDNVRASVTAGDLHVSLLGMSFLGRLGEFSISGERLTLRPAPNG